MTPTGSRPEVKHERAITLRDRRKPRQYSIENRIMDEYRPLIGAAGLDVYNLYVRMSNKRDEKLWPAYSLIQEHLGIGRSTVSEMNQLLEWCGLIHIERGDYRRPNVYYILEPQPVTTEFLEDLRKTVAERWGQRAIGRTVLRRIEGWKSFQQRCEGRRRARGVRVVRPPSAQMRLVEGSTTGLQGSTPGLQGSTGGLQSSTTEPQSSTGGLKQDKQNSTKGTSQREQSKQEQTVDVAQGLGQETIANSRFGQETIANNELGGETSSNGGKLGRETFANNGPNGNGMEVLELLLAFGIFAEEAGKLASLSTVEMVNGWIDYAESQESLHSPKAFVVAKLRAGEDPPAEGYRGETFGEEAERLQKEGGW